MKLIYVFIFITMPGIEIAMEAPPASAESSSSSNSESSGSNAVVSRHEQQQVAGALTMFRDEKKASPMYLPASVSNSRSSGSSNALAEIDLEAGNGGDGKQKARTEPIALRNESGTITDAKGKRLSVKLSLGDTISLEIDDNDPKFHKELARTLLQVIYADQESPHKDYKYVRPHLEKALKAQHESPRNAKMQEELHCLRKVSAAQMSNRNANKISRRSLQPSVHEVRSNLARIPGKNSPTPRELFLYNSPHKNDTRAAGANAELSGAVDTAYSELKDLLLKELADAGASQKTQKTVYQLLSIGGPVATALVTWLITHFTSHS